MPHARRLLGDRGERAVELALAARGIRTIARNVRMRHGEIDLVCEDAQGYLFVEVKTRRSASFVAALEAVDPRKLRRLARLAECWLAATGQRGAPWRLAVAAVTVEGDRAYLDLVEVS